jgi:hypothetical protein
MKSASAVAVVIVGAVVVGSVAGRAQEEAPLPDLEAFSRAVRENLARSERVAHLYAFNERRTDVHTNPFGRLGTGGTRLFEVYPSATRELRYRRLVDRDGVPLDAEELAEQDREYRERAADALRRLAAGDEDERRSREEDAARARERGEQRITDLMATLQFQVDGRTVYEGVPAIVVAFAPRPGAKPETWMGRMAQRFVGTVWVDEAAAEVMRVEATSVDSISFGFGLLARLGKGAEATLTRQAVAQDFWMPNRMKLKGQGRAVMFLRKLEIDFVVEWFDYRRLGVDSATPFPNARVQGEPGGGPDVESGSDAQVRARRRLPGRGP